MDFQFRYIRTHNEEKTIKIVNITLAILRFPRKHILIKLIAILSNLESISFDKTIRFLSKWFILTQKTQNLEVINLKCVCYAEPIPLSLTRVAKTESMYSRCYT